MTINASYGHFQQAQQWLIKPSLLLKHCLLVLHGLASIACWLSAILVVFKVGITLLIFFNGDKIYSAKTEIGRSWTLRNHVDGRWEIAEIGFDYQTITLLPSTVISTWMTIIHYQISERPRKSLVVVKDSLTEDDYRQLIVKLKVMAAD